jgi:hypothetical protein|tara:strand:+ start:46 stop:159 length:114 start_codon:yes stop_codon:yes gene_type:complete
MLRGPTAQAWLQVKTLIAQLRSKTTNAEIAENAGILK